MTKLNRRSISRRTVEALKVEKETVFWDRDQPGFGVRVYASGTRMYVVQARTKGKSVRVTVGRHGVISANEARRRAARILNRIKAGEDPVAEALPARLVGGPTVADLAERYMEKHVAVHCKDSTAKGIRILLDKHILPEFGKLPLLAAERERVAAVPCPAERRASRGEPGTGAAVADVHDGRFLGHGARRHEPVPGDRAAPGGQARSLSDRHGVPTPRRGSGRGPREGRGIGPSGGGDPAFDADGLPQERDPVLAMEGRRPRGRQVAVARKQDGSAHGAAVAAGGEGAGGAAARFGQPLGDPRPEVGHAHDERGRPVAVEDVRIHDCRHSFASRALALGESLPAIAKLLGHSQIQTTARYAHLARASVKASAARVAASIAEDFMHGTGPVERSRR